MTMIFSEFPEAVSFLCFFLLMGAKERRNNSKRKKR